MGLLLFAAVALAVHSLRTKKPKTPKTPERDVGIGEAIAFMCLGKWGSKFMEAVGAMGVDATANYNSLLQAAADGTIPVWGKRPNNGVYEPKMFRLRSRPASDCRPSIGGQAFEQSRGAANRGEYRQAAGVIAQGGVSSCRKRKPRAHKQSRRASHPPSLGSYRNASCSPYRPLAGVCRKQCRGRARRVAPQPSAS